MGLRCSHDAFYGAYSAFNRFRQELAFAAGGSYPTHYKRNEDGSFVKKKDSLGNEMIVIDRDMDEKLWYADEIYLKGNHMGLVELFNHSDCDGEISPEMCLKVANDLEILLPIVKKLGTPDSGHIGKLGGYYETTKKFIRGCRLAHENNEPLEFY